MTDDSFSRQRRNLLLASTVLAVASGADIRVEQLPLWSAVPAAASMWAFYLVMWSICLYFFFGFGVHFFVRRFRDFAAAFAEARRLGVEPYLHRLGQQRGGSARHTETPEPISVWPLDIDVEIHKHFDANQISDEGQGPPSEAVVVERDYVRVNRAVWALLVVRATLAKLASGVCFFEYVLPLVWFAVAIGIANAGDWPGSWPAIWHDALADTPSFQTSIDGGPAGALFRQTLCVWPKT
ncbi:hypothetical protein [Xylophilus sp. GOD-11R]|uniref:hypothetical protein n=1 Tax=Xylophilus sp. GOD-11R TaxID=3089814 RepID=UPI00298C40A6|nr:hypothetical protein [Xylophilus sp. GOD-11R]WPB54970.1 hypothetical protein R9X41_12380 [Xylophilus sp. GOD-11R]